VNEGVRLIPVSAADRSEADQTSAGTQDADGAEDAGGEDPAARFEVDIDIDIDIDIDSTNLDGLSELAPLDGPDAAILASLIDDDDLGVMLVEPPTGEFESVRVIRGPEHPVAEILDGPATVLESGSAAAPDPIEGFDASAEGDADAEAEQIDDSTVPDGGPATETTDAVSLSATSEVTGLVEIIEVDTPDPEADRAKISAELLEDDWDAPALIVRRTQKPTAGGWFRRKKDNR
jgi:hypothetical protein